MVPWVYFKSKWSQFCYHRHRHRHRHRHCPAAAADGDDKSNQFHL